MCRIFGNMRSKNIWVPDDWVSFFEKWTAMFQPQICKGLAPFLPIQVWVYFIRPGKYAVVYTLNMEIGWTYYSIVKIRLQISIKSTFSVVIFTVLEKHWHKRNLWNWQDVSCIYDHILFNIKFWFLWTIVSS